MATIRQVFTSDDRDVQRSLQSFVRETAKLREENVKLKQTNKQAATEARAQMQEQRQLAAEAARVLQSIQSPAEAYRQKIKGLQELLQKGKLDQQQYNKAVEQAAAEHRDLKSRIDGTEAAQKALAASAAKVIDEIATPAERYADQLEHINRLLTSGKLSQEQHARAVAKAGDEFAELTAKIDGTAREHSELEREAKRVLESIRTPAERYSQSIDRLNKLVEAGKLDHDQYARAVEREKQALNDSARASGGAKAAVGSQLASMVAGITSVQAFASSLRQVIDRLHEMRQEAAEAQFSVDELTRGLQIQAGLSDLEAGEQRDQILQSAFTAGVGEKQAFAAAQQLVSSGFKDPVESGTLDTFLAIAQSSNKAQEDPVALAQASGQFLAAFGKEKNAENLLDLGVAVRGLFKETDVQITDLSEFAKAAPAFANANVSLKETLAILGTLREVEAPGEAATQARNVATILQTSGDKKPVREALESVGLTKEDVDLEGESFTEALNRINDKTAGLGQAQRAQFLNKIFGRENTLGASVLLDNTDRIAELKTFQEDEEGFEQGVQVARSGIGAAKRKAEIIRLRAQLTEENKAAQAQIARSLRESRQIEAITQADEAGNTVEALARTAAKTGQDFNASILGESGAQSVLSTLLQGLGPVSGDVGRFAANKLGVLAPDQQQRTQDLENLQNDDFRLTDIDRRNRPAIEVAAELPAIEVAAGLPEIAAARRAPDVASAPELAPLPITDTADAIPAVPSERTPPTLPDDSRDGSAGGRRDSLDSPAPIVQVNVTAPATSATGGAEALQIAREQTELLRTSNALTEQQVRNAETQSRNATVAAAGRAHLE